MSCVQLGGVEEAIRSWIDRVKLAAVFYCQETVRAAFSLQFLLPLAPPSLLPLPRHLPKSSSKFSGLFKTKGEIAGGESNQVRNFIWARVFSGPTADFNSDCRIDASL